MARRGRQGGGGKRPGQSLDAFLRHRRRRPWWYLVVVAALALAVVWADRQGLGLHAGDDLARYDGGRFRVDRVIDGDTLDLAARDGEHRTTRVRLWGIDTPERARPREDLPAEPFADEAWRRAIELADGREVSLVLEPHRVRDNHGRLLAHVALPDGTLLSDQLLVEGLATADGRWPHRHAERFELLAEQAERSGRGLWGGSDGRRGR